jgi:peptide/nickel transport system permease protein
MARYILNRVLSGLLTLFLFLTLLFFLANLVIPGDFVTSLGPMTGDDANALRDELGLNRPLYEQYFDWLGSLVTLDMGESFSQGSVWETVRFAMAPTLVVLTIGLLVAFVLGGWLGRTAGYRGSSYFTGSMTFIAILCLTLFPPALAIAIEQGILRNSGWSALGRVAELDGETWLGSVMSPNQILWRVFFVFAASALALWLVESLVWRFARRRMPRGIFLIAMVAVPLLIWAQMGIANHVLDLAGTMSLLIVAVVILTFGEVLLVTKASMDDVMLEDYVMVARAKGMPEHQVRDRHAARTALLPVLSRFTVAIPYFLTGLVILEVAFGGGANLPIANITMRFQAPVGLGSLLFGSLSSQDNPLLIGALLIVGVLTLLIRIVLDVVHAALDPRIRFGSGANGT